jgi:hypothetical protein
MSQIYYKWVDKDGEIMAWGTYDPEFCSRLGFLNHGMFLENPVFITEEEYKAHKLKSDMEIYGMSSEDPDFCCCCQGKCEETPTEEK